MKLSEYVKIEIEHLKEFEQDWKIKNKENPDVWPNDMNAGEWDEQYRFWKPED